MINLQNVLITGAGGFIGCHLTESLIKRGAKVKTFCHYNSLQTCDWLDSIEKSIFPEIEIIWGYL
jgi:nucleoside-diphosphate-sugar epimerase